MTPSATPQHNLPEYSVSEIAGALKRVVEDHFGHVRVRGEISGFKRHSSGHLYFSLKDQEAVINGVCWRGVGAKLKFQPEDGLEVIATGRVSTYPGRSQYQLIVEWMEPAGAGALMALLEKRKAMLAQEGLFAPERKKALPFMPRVVGVITSPTGAVIRDILHRIRDRFPCHVIVWPVAVQGEGAAEQIAAAIEGFNGVPGFGFRVSGSEGNANIPEPGTRNPKPDVLIVARGGGSIEDLWAFNEEIVVRAAAASRIPLISAVGHETDTTLIDFAADRRAPTPTAAAEMAVPVRAELIAALGERSARLGAGVERALARLSQNVEGLARGLPHPQRMLEAATQRLDDWAERLSLSLLRYTDAKAGALARLAAALAPAALLRETVNHMRMLTQYGERLLQAAEKRIVERERAAEACGRMLASLDYHRVLARGFALIRDEVGRPLTSAAALSPGQPVRLEFHDGERAAEVSGAPKPRSKPAKAEPQGSLL